MANKYRFTEKAERDLEKIIDYTFQQWGELQVHSYIDGLEAQTQLLADNPNLGVPRKSIFDGLFSFPYESHVLYYVQESDGITIVRVLHHGMEPINHI